ncbi:hypothetical protein Sinac_3807 [Singulisphaera acidiphila DSM 18658]|uniref:Uncharacterized protein n=1 Tax=Singulisphaera acidiphila (strain ATCC BAA-1392 / DSM 18658 / VKM B-2454 / MOB10) TaxID=886293 RepID=L0DGR5_SINAD|nr:hypothetical protein Sinac_3807 [Singulisphaera acidiphila DSM 18658]
MAIGKTIFRLDKIVKVTLHGLFRGVKKNFKTLSKFSKFRQE